MQQVVRVVREAVDSFIEDGCLTQAAAVAYYAMFSVPPMVVLLVAATGFVLGEEAAADRLVREVARVASPELTEAVRAVADEATSPDFRNSWAAVISVGALVFGASGVFSQLQSAVNIAWDAAEPDGHPLRVVVFKRLLSFAMIGLIGVALVGALVLEAALTGLAEPFDQVFGEGGAEFTRLVGSGVWLVVLTGLIVATFKILPDVSLHIRDVLLGATVTSLLVLLGTLAVGAWIGASDMASAYGAAGSLAIVLLWAWLAAISFLFGVELTQVWARHHGKGLHGTMSDA